MDFKVFCSIGFSLCSLVFSLMFLFIYLTKRKQKKVESHLYSALLVLNVIGCIIEFLHVYSMDKHLSEAVMQLFCKLHPASFVLRLYVIMAYITTLVYNFKPDKKYVRNGIYIVLGSFAILNLIFICSFDVTLVFDDFIYDFSSDLHTYLVMIPYISIGFFLFSLIFNSRIIKKHEFAPLLFAVLIVTIASVTQTIFDIDANFQNYLLTLLAAAFYFTTENQDVKLLDETNMKKIELDKYSKVQNDFLINASHEIRTPMNTICGLTSLMIDSDLTYELAKENMDHIKTSVLTLDELVDNVADISNIEANKEVVVTNEYKIEDIEFEIYNRITPKLDGKQLTFNITSSSDLPSMLRGDKDKLIKIIINILTCAINNTNYGKIDLEIKKILINNKFNLDLVITNSGNTFKEEDFNLDFYNNNGAIIDGVKLGLISAKKYIRFLNGRIDFSSDIDTRYHINIEQEVINNTPSNLVNGGEN